MSFYHNRSITATFDAAIGAVTEALKKEGFGVLTKIDLAEKFKEKLGIDFRRYVILGACNPSLAHKALLVEDKIGVMLPCNVIIQDKGQGKIEVAAIDPNASMAAVGNSDLTGIAVEVSAKLKRVVDTI
jgi:uncharacterized protein (DUF302 family)